MAVTEEAIIGTGLKPLAGRHALVTGAARGIGRATALALAQLGADVTVNYISSAPAAENLAQELLGLGVCALAVRADVADANDVREMFAAAESAVGPVHVLVNNAGMVDDGLMLRMSDESWRRVLAVDLDGAFHCSRQALPAMLRERWGRIVNVTSIVALDGNPGQANYSAAKAGLIGLTKSLAREVARRGVTVNAVAPGLIDTDITRDVAAERQEEMRARIPAGRPGTPEEVASAITFLCSGEAGYITGQVLRVDGGLQL